MSTYFDRYGMYYDRYGDFQRLHGTRSTNCKECRQQFNELDWIYACKVKHIFHHKCWTGACTAYDCAKEAEREAEKVKILERREMVVVAAGGTGVFLFALGFALFVFSVGRAVFGR
ncbi:MAG: hypothetical protein JSS30_04520 [Verrucomicrobia bacterium]|nr:hypothetical protein [Verrucomicrobiota bacterium]